jgi:hypothetical protein
MYARVCAMNNFKPARLAVPENRKLLRVVSCELQTSRESLFPEQRPISGRALIAWDARAHSSCRRRQLD